MTKATGILREYPAGTALSGITVAIKDEATGLVAISSDVTDAGGRWDFAENGSSNGPWFWSATDTTPTPDVIRKGSSLNAGSGGFFSLYEIPAVLRALGNGVIRGYLNALAITDPGTAKNLSYATGACVVQGIPVVFSTAGTHAVVTATDAANTKACYLVVEVTPAGQTAEGKAVLKDTCGAAAASPSLPALTQSEVLYQFPLASFVLGITGATAANSITTVTDLRTYALQRNPVVSSVVRRTDPTATTTTTSTTGADLTTLTTTVTLVSGVTYDIEARGTAAVKNSSTANTTSIAPYIDGTGNIASYVSGNTADYALLSNTYTLEGVLGTGAAVSCGLRWKVSAGTGTATTGTLAVIARPRS